MGVNVGKYPKTRPAIVYRDMENTLTEEVFNDICVDIALGESVKFSVESRGFNVVQFYRLIWDRDELSKKYDHAKERGLLAMADLLGDEASYTRPGEIRTIKRELNRETGELVVVEDTVQVVDNVNRSRLAVATNQWQLARLARRKFGDTNPDNQAAPGDRSVLVVPGAATLEDWERASADQRVRLTKMAEQLESKE